MALIIEYGCAPAHHPMFGISTKNIAERIATENWKSKALLRSREDNVLYVMISFGVEKSTGSSYYSVMVSSASEKRGALTETFPSLEAALAYANGDDGGDIACDTVPVPKEQYPTDTQVQVMIFTRGKY